jgi:cytochrome c oxidase cbb3-type subunit 3
MSRDRQTPGRDELLDHEADGIREFDNDLPRWWLYGFYFTIAVGAIYMLNFHVLAQPLVGRAGMVAEYNADLEASRDALASRARAGGAVAGQLVELRDAASLTAGDAIFHGPDQVCYSCHRADLGGMIGPNLTDDQWLHGCSVEAVVTSIKTGYPQKGMMPFGSGKPLSDQQVLQLASYIRSRHGSAPANPRPIDPERDKACP